MPARFSLHPLALKAVVFLLCLGPLAYYGLGVGQDTLGANPLEALIRGLGTWALNFLLITLAVTPLRRAAGWNWLLPLRRMLGLFCFFYAVLHWGSYLWLDQFFDWTEILQDIIKRPFITVGMLAFTLLLPLALTSNRYSIRRLGGRHWQRLHRLVYLIGMLAVLHYTWMVKADLAGPLAYAAVLALLLGARLRWYLKGVEVRPRIPATLPRTSGPARRVIPIQVRK